MTIYIEGESATDVTSYNGLLLSVARWLDRDDLTERAPDFIRLAEGRFRDTLVMPDMEVQTTITPAASLALPSDFDSIRALGILGYPPIDQLSPADFYALPTQSDGTAATGQPVKMAIVAGNFAFWPTPDQTYSMLLTYRANLPALSLLNQSNWLLARRPDLYLFGTLLHAEFYGWNDERLPLIKAAIDEALNETIMAGVRRRYGSGPLTMKPAVSERVGRCW